MLTTAVSRSDAADGPTVHISAFATERLNNYKALVECKPPPRTVISFTYRLIVSVMVVATHYLVLIV